MEHLCKNPGNIREVSDDIEDEESVGYPNKQFQEIIKSNKGKKYIEENFQYSLLETFDKDTPKEYVIARESYWKNVLGTREFGYNAN